MQNLWKANWLNDSRAIKIFNIFDSEIPFLGLDPKEIGPNTEEEEKKKMFAMVLFIIAKTKQQKRKHPVCPFIGEEWEKSSGGTIWQHASYEKHMITWKHFITRLEMTVT